MNKTPIEWCRTYRADGSFEEGFSVNPVRFKPRGAARLVTMCQKVSPGCAHCYAETITRRFWPKDADEKFPGYTAQGILAGDFVLNERALDSVLRRKKPARIFWGDMTDLFGEWVPDKFLNRCFAVCALTPQHTHMFLTKRTGRMHEYFGVDHGWQQVREALIGQQVSKIDLERTGNPVSEWSGLPMPNLWLGTSVENQEQANIRIPFLLRTTAAVRFISAEPLLGEVQLNDLEVPQKVGTWCFDALEDDGVEDPDFHGARIDWVIVGGESGQQARPMHAHWANSLLSQCETAGVPFFFKQWGAWIGEAYGSPIPPPDIWLSVDGRRATETEARGPGAPWLGMWRVGKKTGDAKFEGLEYREFPEVTRG